MLFLDEPTIGLDVVSQKKVREFLREYNAEQRVVTMLTSHYMQDIEELCERVIVIDDGRIIFDGPLDTITRASAAGKSSRWNSRGRTAAGTFPAWARCVARTDETVKLRVPRAEVAAVCRRLFEVYPVRDISVEDVPIEEVIAQLFANDGVGRGAVGVATGAGRTDGASDGPPPVSLP